MISTMVQLPTLFSYLAAELLSDTFASVTQSGPSGKARLQGRWQLALDLIRSMASRDDSCLQESAAHSAFHCQGKLADP